MGLNTKSLGVTSNAYQSANWLSTGTSGNDSDDEEQYVKKLITLLERERVISEENANALHEENVSKKEEMSEAELKCKFEFVETKVR